MLGTIIATAGGLAGSLIGGNKAKKEMRRQRAILRDQLMTAKANALRYGNQDFSQSASAQDAVAQTQQLNEQNMQNARGADAVMGGNSTNTAIAANADAQAKLASSLAQQGEAQRQSARQYYDTQANTALSQIAANHAAQAQQNTLAANQAMNAGANFAIADIQSHLDSGRGMLENLFGKKKKDQQSATEGTTTG